MKKLVVLGLAAIAGWALWSKYQQEKAERELWAEVTDAFGEDPEDVPAYQSPVN